MQSQPSAHCSDLTVKQKHPADACSQICSKRVPSHAELLLCHTQAKSGPTSKPEDRTKRISRASFSINASSLRRAPVAPSAPVSAMEPDSAPAVAGLYRTSSNGTAKTMSVDGGKDPDHVSDPATASTADSNR